MKVDENSQLFLLLVWLVTIVAMIASIWLLKDVKQASTIIKQEQPTAPYAIPREAANARSPKFEVPPPPF